MVNHNLQRGISQMFIRHLTSGVLLPLLERVRHDDTLTLEVRSGYVDIYYRGGRVLGIHGNGASGRFRAEFDMNYCNIDPAYCPSLPTEPPRSISSERDAREWVDALASYKQVMDVFFSDHPKLEREFQQNVLRDNNRHSVGERTEYTILDIEYAQSPDAFPGQSNFRFDMVGMLWPTRGRDRRSRLATPVLVEMKAGDGALASHSTADGKRLSGLAKHVEDIEAFLRPEPPALTSLRYDLLRAELAAVLRTKRELGLPSIPKAMATLEIEEWSERPQVLFILANHQPASTILRKELAKLPPRLHADYFVAKVSYAGYALFSENVMPLDEFIAELGASAPPAPLPGQRPGQARSSRAFGKEMEEFQVRWREGHVAATGDGIQNGVSRRWILPAAVWEEGLWPPLRGAGADSVPTYLERHGVQRHTGSHNLKSSWVAGANLYFPFRRAGGRGLLAGFLGAHVDARVETLQSVELEWAGEGDLSPAALLGERGGSRGSSQTSPDLAFLVNGGAGLLLVENKFTEDTFYSCPAHRPPGPGRRPGNRDPGRCDDVAALAGDPSLCHQQAWGRRYWERLRGALDGTVARRLPRCPAATGGYQLLRQQALAEAIVMSGRYEFVVSAVALDARNKRLAGCLRTSGMDDVRDWAGLFHGRASFAVFTHQAWAAWVRANDADGSWSIWADWMAARYAV